MFISSISDKKNSCISKSIKTLEALNIGLPVVIGGIEHVMVDDIYQRHVDCNTASSNKCTVIGFPGTATSFMAFVEREMTDVEFIQLTSMLALNEKRKNLSVKIIDLVQSIYDDFNNFKNIKFEIGFAYDSNDNKISFKKHISATVSSSKKCMLNCPELFEINSAITQVDGLWPITITTSTDDNKDNIEYIYGSSINIFGKIKGPECEVKPENNGLFR